MTLTLPQRMYLLGADPDDNKPVIGMARFRGELMRAAALIELTLQGQIQDQRGKAVAAPATGSVDDHFVASVLGDVTAGDPRRWATLISQHAHTAEAAVRSRLAEAGHISAGGSAGEVVVRELQPVRLLRNQTRDVVLLQLDPATVPADLLATAVLTAEGEVDTVLTLSERWTHRKHLKALTKHFDTLVPGPAAGLRTANATARSYNGGWS